MNAGIQAMRNQRQRHRNGDRQGRHNQSGKPALFRYAFQGVHDTQVSSCDCTIMNCRILGSSRQRQAGIDLRNCAISAFRH